MKTLALYYYRLVKRSSQWEYFNQIKNNKTPYRKVVSDKLTNLLKYASKNVPFYQEFFKEKHLNEELIESNPFEVLSKLPIITKQMLNDESEKFQSAEKRIGIYENFTGGSTGIPLRVLQDREYSDWSGAVGYLFLDWAGWSLHDRILKIWGSARDVLGQGKGLKRKLSTWLFDIKILDAFKISSENIDRYIKEIEQYKPAILECYVDAAYAIASEILRRGIELKHKPKGIIVSAGTLYPEFEKVIVKAFNAPVFNRYGSREAGDIASSCPYGTIHVSPFTHYVEIVNEKNEPLEEGTGKIILTVLTNYTMPLIRYEIGDVATVSKYNNICKCGRDWQTLNRIEGRDISMFKKKGGSLISPFFLIHFIGVVHNKGFIEKYQVIQEDYDKYIIKLVIRKGYSKNSEIVRNNLEELLIDFKKVLGEDSKIDIEYCDEIPPSSSGKYLFFISKVKEGE